MQYLGGKTLIAKQIVQVILSLKGRHENFVSLFCGACSVESKISGFERKILNDSHYYLIEMFKALQ